MLILIGAIVAIEMIPVRLTVERAGGFGVGAVAPVVLGVLLLLGRRAAGLPVSEAPCG